MGRLIDATTFTDLEARRFTLRVSATRRDTKASRKDTKMQQGSELPGLGQGASSVKSERDSLDGDARIRAEIDQQPRLALRHSQIVENLPTVFVGQSAHRLELQDYLSKAKDVRYVLLLDLLALVEDRQLLRGFKRNLPQGELLLKALLIHLFAPHVAHRLVDVKQRALYGIHFVTIEQFVFHAAYYTNIILRRLTRPRTVLFFRVIS